MAEITVAQIDSAITDLAQGKRKVRLSMGDKMIEYSNATLDELQALRDRVLAGTQTAKRFVRITSSKGF